MVSHSPLLTAAVAIIHTGGKRCRGDCVAVAFFDCVAECGRRGVAVAPVMLIGCHDVALMATHREISSSIRLPSRCQELRHTHEGVFYHPAQPCENSLSGSVPSVSVSQITGRAGKAL